MIELTTDTMVEVHSMYETNGTTLTNRCFCLILAYSGFGLGLGYSVRLVHTDPQPFSRRSGKHPSLRKCTSRGALSYHPFDIIRYI